MNTTNDTKLRILQALACAAVVALSASPLRAAESRAKIKESTLLSQVVRQVKAKPDVPVDEVLRLANALVIKEGVNFKVALAKERTEGLLEAAFFGAIEDGQLANKLGYYRLTLDSLQISSGTCGKNYYLPFMNNPLEQPGLLLQGAPAYFKNHGGLRFENVALLEKGRSKPVRRWPLPDESEVPVGLSADGKTLYLQYRLASAETGWVPVKAGGQDRLLLAVGPRDIRFAPEAEIAGQTWDTLEALPWKSPKPEGDFQAFGVLKAGGKDYYFGFENLCH